MENLNYQLQQSTKEELIHMLTEIAGIVNFNDLPQKHERSYKHIEIANVFSAIVSGEYYNELKVHRTTVEKQFNANHQQVSTRL
jgi:hypothetical protein